MSQEDTEAPSEAPLAATLLRGEETADARTAERWAYSKWGRRLVSAFVLYHAAILLVHNLPAQGLSRGLHRFFNVSLDMHSYLRATGTTQSWEMFAPNPRRNNVFMKVLVVDRDGVIHDLKHDAYGVDRFPYLFYDRLGKINRRIGDRRGYRPFYAAWVCREWERTHGGEAADTVRFVRMWTQIPHPDRVIAGAGGRLADMGYDPMQLPLREREEDTFACRSTPHARLPDTLRRRYGLPPVGSEDEPPVRGPEERS
ncbi:MAG: hypothetical protein MJE66_18750 [Proteobacteria bacterium]|nr:hypothetical protein [Pseudomonadota bacterium]